MTPPAGVDLFLGQSHAELGIGAERAEKAGQRREVADLDLVGLAVTIAGNPSAEAPANAALAFNRVRRL